MKTIRQIVKEEIENSTNKLTYNNAIKKFKHLKDMIALKHVTDINWFINKLQFFIEKHGENKVQNYIESSYQLEKLKTDQSNLFDKNQNNKWSDEDRKLNSQLNKNIDKLHKQITTIFESKDAEDSVVHYTTDWNLVKKTYPKLVKLMKQFKDGGTDMLKQYRKFIKFKDAMKQKDFYEKYFDGKFHTSVHDTPVGKHTIYQNDVPFMYYDFFKTL